MSEECKKHKCGECALYNTDACYLLFYVNEEHAACDEFIGYKKKSKVSNKEEKSNEK